MPLDNKGLGYVVAENIFSEVSEKIHYLQIDAGERKNHMSTTIFLFFDFK